MPLRTLVQLPERLPRSGDVDFFKLWSGDRAGGEISDVIEHWWRQDRQILNQLPDKPAEKTPPPQPPPPGIRIPIPDPQKPGQIQRTW
jgi:hypothetical protein